MYSMFGMNIGKVKLRSGVTEGSALGVIALPSTKKLASFKRIILRIIIFFFASL